MDNSAPRSHELLDKNPRSRHGVPPYGLLVREDPEAPKRYKLLLSLALVCQPGLPGMTLLLKTWYTVVVG